MAQTFFSGRRIVKSGRFGELGQIEKPPGWGAGCRKLGTVPADWIRHPTAQAARSRWRPHLEALQIGAWNVSPNVNQCSTSRARCPKPHSTAGPRQGARAITSLPSIGHSREKRQTAERIFFRPEDYQSQADFSSSLASAMYLLYTARTSPGSMSCSWIKASTV